MCYSITTPNDTTQDVEKGRNVRPDQEGVLVLELRDKLEDVNCAGSEDQGYLLLHGGQSVQFRQLLADQTLVQRQGQLFAILGSRAETLQNCNCK